MTNGTPMCNGTTGEVMKARPAWSPSSWREKKILQQPEYKDPTALKKALEKVASLPPLIHWKEVDSLQSQLAAAARGERFLIQGGDCAERFVDCSKDPIENKFKILLQMSLIVVWCARIPTIRVARLAGQFAKPRSSPVETLADGRQVSSFKGDNVNGFDPDDREPNPDRLTLAYFHSAATINYVRALIAGGAADLHQASNWNLRHIADPAVREEYSKVISRILDGFDFLNTIHADESETTRTVELFTSHEGLLLGYEEALTREICIDSNSNSSTVSAWSVSPSPSPVNDSSASGSPRTNTKFYNLGAHFLWIGDRTRQLDGAHIEYFRGISNPIGVKIGPSMTGPELAELVKVLNPNREGGHLTLITRYGASKVETFLPEHIKAVKATGVPVVWCCDPCHGNTETTESGVKTRNFVKVLQELVTSFQVHASCDSILGGVHLELSGEDVTECVGGSQNLVEDSLQHRYETLCDPRLNYTQSLDMAFQIARLITSIQPRSRK